MQTTYGIVHCNTPAAVHYALLDIAFIVPQHINQGLNKTNTTNAIIIKLIDVPNVRIMDRFDETEKESKNSMEFLWFERRMRKKNMETFASHTSHSHNFRAS